MFFVSFTFGLEWLPQKLVPAAKTQAQVAKTAKIKRSLFEGSLKSNFFENMERWKSRGGKSKRGEEKKREDQGRDRVRRKKMQARKKEEKIAIHSVFPRTCGSGGSKSRLAKAAGAEPSGQMRDARRCGAKHIWKSKCAKHTFLGPLLEAEMLKRFTLLWREAHVGPSKVSKT